MYFIFYVILLDFIVNLINTGESIYLGSPLMSLFLSSICVYTFVFFFRPRLQFSCKWWCSIIHSVYCAPPQTIAAAVTVDGCRTGLLVSVC